MRTFKPPYRKPAWSLLAVLFLGLAVLSGDRAAAEDKQPEPKPVFDYALYSKTLSAHVDTNGMVTYKDLQRDRKDLDAFSLSLGRQDKTAFEKWTEDQRVALLVNAYNAFTLQLIIDNYPIRKSGWFSRFPDSSIRQIDGAWDEVTFKLMGTDVTLEHIEHEILRKDYDRPGIHMALVCAAMSCPPLRNEAYTGAKLKNQLSDQARKFLGHSGKFKLDRDDKRVYLSPIFKWFKKDFLNRFGTDEKFKSQNKYNRAVLNYIVPYLPADDRAWIESAKYRIKYLDYDWSLNEKKGK